MAKFRADISIRIDGEMTVDADSLEEAEEMLENLVDLSADDLESASSSHRVDYVREVEPKPLSATIQEVSGILAEEGEEPAHG